MIASKATKTAIAIFVKTPTLSRVKTRLGHKIGERKATKFYELSLNKIKAELKLMEKELGHNCVDIYWALAEPLNPYHTLYWNDFKFIHQSGSSLGSRLSGVYNDLIRRGYGKVILMGGDSPQLSAQNYSHWCQMPIKDKQVVLGPAKDGGFYTLIGASSIPAQIWESVNYSESTTFEQLDKLLVNSGYKMFYLNNEIDIDFLDDLRSLDLILKSTVSKSKEDLELLSFISSIK